MQYPKVSVVTPALNQADFIGATIESVLAQNYPNLEYFVVDGGSSDETVAIIERYAHALAGWSSEPDDGQYDAINKGFARATGDVLCWLNADDLHCPWCLHTVGAIFASCKDVHWLSTLNRLAFDTTGTPTHVDVTPGFAAEAFLRGLYMPHQNGGGLVIQQESTFWTRDLWDRAGGQLDTSFGLAGDFELWARFFELEALYGTTVPLAGFRRRQGQRSEQIERYAEEAAAVLEAARQRRAWREPFARRLLASPTLHELPGLGRLTRSSRRFDGVRINRCGAGTSTPTWATERHRFEVG